MQHIQGRRDYVYQRTCQPPAKCTWICLERSRGHRTSSRAMSGIACLETVQKGNDGWLCGWDTRVGNVGLVQVSLLSQFDPNPVKMLQS